MKLFTQESLISKSMLDRAAHGFWQDILTLRLQDLLCVTRGGCFK